MTFKPFSLNFKDLELSKKGVSHFFYEKLFIIDLVHLNSISSINYLFLKNPFLDYFLWDFYINTSLNPILYPFKCKYTGQNCNVGYVSGRSHKEQIKQLLGPYFFYYLEL